jgi:hypothetical protein
MPDARQGYSATLLSDGRVLISGGFITAPGRVSGQSEVPTAELYDPTTGQFTQTGAMISPRHWATATRLANGRVLIAGGDTYETYKSVSLAAAELYDPVSGKFSAAGTMTTPREMHFATLLLDGRVLINGGMDITATSAVELNSAEIYQP